MKVSAQYAQDHFAAILGAVDRGEEVQIERTGKPGLRLIVDAAPGAAPVAKKRLIGAAKGRVWLAEDWDSAETNQAIEALFEHSTLFAEPPAE